MSLLTQIFGSRNQRLLKQYQKIVQRINALEANFKKMSDIELQTKTQKFKQKIADGMQLDDLLPEVFAVCREASVRILKMRYFDVQLIGGMALHFGKIAEMRTGEGKTLMATLPVYLNALSGKGVHVVTVNDYLAQRDAEWMSKLYNWLGLTTGINLSQMNHSSKQKAYKADVIYGTNNEFGFDYLRDNMVFNNDDRVQRSLNFAILDEVDSILIDEARTPLIISGPAENHTDLYHKINVVPSLLSLQICEEISKNQIKNIDGGDYIKDEKNHQVFLTEAGHEKAEQILIDMGLLLKENSLYEASNILLMHHLYAALRAHALYQKDQHYVVQNGEVIIVDEFTGRLMIGRRWSDGLHQAIEAKEKVKVQSENQTLASITFQNYFRMYKKLSGMTGTADTEAYEFQEIYNLETVVIPPNCASARKDRQDQVYKTSQEKYQAMLKDIQDCYERNQPVLVGTTSIKNSELLSNILNLAKLPHNVLNAKHHAREAEIIAQAGRPKMITIATSMAGRGTDIVLGGNIEKQIQLIEINDVLSNINKQLHIKKIRNEWQLLHDLVIKAGGLHIIGTERHESRRVDNQLRGRSGRQGDPGSSRFYLSLDDTLLRIFAGDRVRSIMNRLKMPDNEPIEAGIVSRSIESAQRKVEAFNFDIRKQLLEYDDVANDQRKVIYQQRNELLQTFDISKIISSLREGVFINLFRSYIPKESFEEQWDVATLETILLNEWKLNISLTKIIKTEVNLTDNVLLKRVLSIIELIYNNKVKFFSQEIFNKIERSIMLQSIDTHWREHLAALDHLRQGIHLRGYAQMNPKQEYKREAFQLFAQMLDLIKNEVVKIIITMDIEGYSETNMTEKNFLHTKNIYYHHTTYHANDAVSKIVLAPVIKHAVESMSSKINVLPKIRRNDPCFCGSNKKYKQCHGRT